MFYYTILWKDGISNQWNWTGKNKNLEKALKEVSKESKRLKKARHVITKIIINNDKEM